MPRKVYSFRPPKSHTQNEQYYPRPIKQLVHRPAKRGLLFHHTLRACGSVCWDLFKLLTPDEAIKPHAGVALCAAHVITISSWLTHLNLR